MAYCTRCGQFADLDPAAMCARCRHAWQPARDKPGDLGYRSQPQPPLPEVPVETADAHHEHRRRP